MELSNWKGKVGERKMEGGESKKAGEGGKGKKGKEKKGKEIFEKLKIDIFKN